MFGNFRRPEYTGANRCYLCTAANVVLLGGLGAVVGVVSPVGAVLLVALGCVTIWLRGYLVPLTPRFGPLLKKLVSEYVIRTPRESGRESLARGDVSGETVVEELLRANVLTTTEGEELNLTRVFEEDWHSAIRAVREMPLEEFEQWAGGVLADTDISSVEAVDPLWFDPYLAFSLESGEETTSMYPVAIAEVAAVAALEDSGLNESIRLHAAGPLRGFLDSCPVCDGALTWSHAEGCCGNPRAGENRPGLVCPPCGTVLYKSPAQ